MEQRINMKKIIIALLVASLMVIAATAGVEQLASCSSDECGAIDKSWSEIRYYVSREHKSHWYNPAEGILNSANPGAGWSGTSKYLTSGTQTQTTFTTTTSDQCRQVSGACTVSDFCIASQPFEKRGCPEQTICCPLGNIGPVSS